jgi:hypothetical protein
MRSCAPRIPSLRKGLFLLQSVYNLTAVRFHLPFSRPSRFLVSVAVNVNEIRSLPGWKKVLLNGERKDQVEKIVAQIDEQTQNFSVRDLYPIKYSSYG